MESYLEYKLKNQRELYMRLPIAEAIIVISKQLKFAVNISHH